MNIYFISQGIRNGYDTYDSAVVVAASENAARGIHPAQGSYEWARKDYDYWKNNVTWADRPDQVDVKYIGEAAPGTEAGIVCASFNAG